MINLDDTSVEICSIRRERDKETQLGFAICAIDHFRFFITSASEEFTG